MNKKIKMILFDVDDTLIYTIDTAYKKTNIAGNRIFNIDLKKEDFLNLYGKYSFEECIKHWYNIKDVNKFIDVYSSVKLEYEYIGNIKKILENIRKNNILVGIVTNSTKEKTERKLKKYINLFDFIYTDAEKPSEKAILDILHKYSNIKNEEVILIGDSENDYLVSKNANINFCGVNTGNKKWDSSIKHMESINDLIKEGHLTI